MTITTYPTTNKTLAMYGTAMQVHRTGNYPLSQKLLAKVVPLLDEALIEAFEAEELVEKVKEAYGQVHFALGETYAREYDIDRAQEYFKQATAWGYSVARVAQAIDALFSLRSGEVAAPSSAAVSGAPSSALVGPLLSLVEGGESEFALCHASPEEIRRIVSFYAPAPAPGKSVASAIRIQSETLDTLFAQQLRLLKVREGNSAFAPHYDDPKQVPGEEDGPKETALRQRHMERLKRLEATHKVAELSSPAVRVFALWHATNGEYLSSIFKGGFAALARVDAGYFGKGLYTTAQARYSREVYFPMYRQGALILCLVSTYSPFPVIKKDMPHLLGKPIFGNYDLHYTPVVHIEDDIYHATTPEEAPLYDEFNVGATSQCIPWYVVVLQNDLSPLLPDREIKSSLEEARALLSPAPRTCLEKLTLLQRTAQWIDDLVPLYFLMGKAHQQLRNEGQAKECFAKVVRLDPQDLLHYHSQIEVLSPAEQRVAASARYLPAETTLEVLLSGGTHIGGSGEGTTVIAAVGAGAKEMSMPAFPPASALPRFAGRIVVEQTGGTHVGQAAKGDTFIGHVVI